MPLSAGMAAKNFLKASRPPADATKPATASFGRPPSLAETSSPVGCSDNSSLGSVTLARCFGRDDRLAPSEAVARSFPRFFGAMTGPRSAVELSRLPF